MKVLDLKMICKDDEDIRNAEKEFLRFKRRLSYRLDEEISYEVVILNKSNGKYKRMVSRD